MVNNIKKTEQKHKQIYPKVEGYYTIGSKMYSYANAKDKIKLFGNKGLYLQELYNCNDKPWNNLNHVNKFFSLLSREDEIKYSLINLQKDSLSITFYEYIKLIYTSSSRIDMFDKEDLIQLYVRIDRIITRFIILHGIVQDLSSDVRLNIEYLKIFKLFAQPISVEDAFNNKAFLKDQLFEKFSIIIKTMRRISTYIFTEFTTLIKFKEDSGDITVLSGILDGIYINIYNDIATKEPNKKHIAFIAAISYHVGHSTLTPVRPLMDDLQQINLLLYKYTLNNLDEIITNDADRKQIETYLEDYVLWLFLQCIYKCDYSQNSVAGFLLYSLEQSKEYFKGEYITGYTKTGLKIVETDNLAFIRAKTYLTAKTYSKKIHRSIIDCLNYVINENIVQDISSRVV